MKNIIRLEQVKPQGNVHIDLLSPALEIGAFELDEYLDAYLPYTKLFENIFIENIIAIPSILMSKLTHQYLHGAKIIFCFKNKSMPCTYKLENPQTFYSYSWKPFDINKAIPKSLAEYPVVYKNERMTFLNALNAYKKSVPYKVLTYIPNELYNVLDEYSQQRIDKCKKHNLGNYTVAEEWFKSVCKQCSKINVKFFSPNAKTYYESMAEMRFEDDITAFKLQGDKLTPEQLAFLHQNAHYYGVDIPTFNYRYNTHKTKDGYTQEIEVVYANGMSKAEYERTVYDKRNADKQDYHLPRFARENLRVRSVENDECNRKAYEWLMYIINNLGDEGLVPGYKRCPKCGAIYHESKGCECGYEKPIEFLSGDNLFYGIENTYEDKEAFSKYYAEYECCEDTE